MTIIQTDFAHALANVTLVRIHGLNGGKQYACTPFSAGVRNQRKADFVGDFVFCSACVTVSRKHQHSEHQQPPFDLDVAHRGNWTQGPPRLIDRRVPLKLQTL
jgi:hypothetical protein